MADMLHIFRGRKASFFVELAAAVIALAGIVYYAVQSNADDCFDLLYMVLMCCGVIAVAAHALLRFEFLLPAAGVLFGVGLGVMDTTCCPPCQTCGTASTSSAET